MSTTSLAATSLKRSNSSPPSRLSAYSPSQASQSSTSSGSHKFSDVFSSKKYINLRTSDGKTFVVEKKLLAKQSLTIKKHAAKFFAPKTILLQKIHSKTLSRVVMYCGNKHAVLVEKFDESLFFDLMEAAAELEINGLIDTLCRLAPNVLRKLTYDNMKDTLDLLSTKAKAAAEARKSSMKFGCLKI